MLASAFLLPPGWQVSCEAVLSQNAAGEVFSTSVFKARDPKSGVELSNLPGKIFQSDDGMIQIPLQAIEQEKMTYGFVHPETQKWYAQTLADNPKPVDLKDFARTQIRALVQNEGGEVTEITDDPIAVQLRERVRKILGGDLRGISLNVVSVNTRNASVPNGQGVLKIIQTIQRSGPVTRWTLDFIGGDAKAENIKEVSQLIDLIISTEQPAPSFQTALAQLNIQLSQQRIAALKSAAEIANITSRALSSVNEKMMAAYKSRSASTDRIHSKIINTTLEVESYINPFDGKEVKMPSENKHYFTNNLGDYIGSSNPLFDPNVSIDSLYNWRKLEASPPR
jgi:hypothetical protein